MVRREGKTSGKGALNGASVTEYGVHDISPGFGGDPRGYLVFTMPDGDIANIKWQVRAVFVPLGSSVSCRGPARFTSNPHRGPFDASSWRAT